MHPYGSFVLCYDTSKWTDGYESIMKSAITVPEYCIHKDSIMDSLETFSIPGYPREIKTPMGEKITTSKERLNYNFMLNDKVQCYVQFFIRC